MNNDGTPDVEATYTEYAVFGTTTYNDYMLVENGTFINDYDGKIGDKTYTANDFLGLWLTNENPVPYTYDADTQLLSMTKDSNDITVILENPVGGIVTIRDDGTEDVVGQMKKIAGSDIDTSGVEYPFFFD